MRKDAQLNLERVLAAAKACFAEHAAATTMEQVSRRAGVGIGTLYRRFGGRAGLVEALYDDAVTQISDQAPALLAHPDVWEALIRWCNAYIGVLATKRSILSELEPRIERDPRMFTDQRRAATKILDRLLKRGQAAGVVRADVQAADVLTLLNATMTAGSGEARLLDIVLAGIRERSD